jgi:tRNA(Ile)-lysidine synthetase-like protein
VVEILPQGQKSEICENVYKLSMKAILCFDTMNDIDGLYCRARQESDKYKLHGMTKSVKKLLWEKKLSAEEKMNFPLICDQKGIVFLPGFDKRDSQDYCSGKEYTVSVYYLSNK